LAELLDVYPQMARWPYVRDMASSVARHDASGDPELLALLRSGDGAQRRQSMRDYLRREFGRVLRIDPARIDEHAPLSRLGLDSLMGLELRRRLEAALGVALEATLVWTYPTVAAVGEYLCEQIAPPLEPVVQLTAAEDRAESLAALSDDQLWNLTNALLN
jgi:acyl carrier protein